jgi:hypothetical protein
MTDLDRAPSAVADTESAPSEASERRKPQLPKAELKTALYALAFVVAGVACVIIQVVRNL